MLLSHMLGQPEATSKCAHHKKLMPLSAFDVNPKTRLPYSKCRICKAKALVADCKYRTTEKGKATVKRFKATEKGKAAKQRYKHGEAGKVANQRYKHGEAGKAANQRYEHGEAGKARVKRRVEVRTQRRRDSPALRMMDTVHSAADSLVSGRYQSSPTFVARTSFSDEAAFLAHLGALVKARGWSWEDHSAVWEIEHKIPQEAFDFNDPEDIQRCWSHANVHVMTKEENREKSVKIIDSFCLQVGSDRFPKSWNGAIPNQEQKEAFYARVQAGQGQAQNTGAGSSSACYTSEEEDLVEPKEAHTWPDREGGA